MGYFDGLASGVIKKDQQGRGVYYPWGILGKGYVLPDEARETAIKKTLILFYQMLFGLIFLHLFVFKNMLLISLAGLVMIGWFLFKSRQLTADCAISTEKLTMKEAYTNSAQKHNVYVLWFFLVVAVIATVMGLLMLLVGKTWIGMIFTLISGGTVAAIGYMIRAKQIPKA